MSRTPGAILPFTDAQAVALLGFVGIIVGSFLPWAKVGFLSIEGTAGDGQITLALGAAGAFFFLIGRSNGWLLVVAMAMAVTAAGIGAYDASNVAELAGEGASLFPVRVGVGLWIVIISGILAALGCLLGDFGQPRRRRR